MVAGLRPTLSLCIVCSLVLLHLGGCPEPDPPPPDATADADTDTLPGGRTYLLGGLAIAYDINAPRRYVISLDKLTAPAPPQPDAGPTDAAASDASANSDIVADTGPGPQDMAEAVVVPLYHLGIPWDEFAMDNVSSLPGPWVTAVLDVKQMLAGLNKPVAIALSPTSLEWDNLTAKASDNGTGGLQIQENWLLNPCHDPSLDGDPKKWEEAYASYVDWIVDKFEPEYVFLARRINRYDERCSDTAPNAYAAIAAFATAAHVKLQQLPNPPITVVTVDVEDLYGFTAEGKKPGRCVIETPQECFELRKGLLDAFTADRLGLESYPAVALPIIKDIPVDWLDRVAGYRSDMKPLIAGTGLPAVSMESPQGVCVPLLVSNETLQRTWLDQVFGIASAYEMELVVWSSPVDQIAASLIAPCTCPENLDFETCEHLKQLGAKADEVRVTLIEGLYTADGIQRDAGRLWVEQLK